MTFYLSEIHRDLVCNVQYTVRPRSTAHPVPSWLTSHYSMVNLEIAKHQADSSVFYNWIGVIYLNSRILNLLLGTRISFTFFIVRISREHSASLKGNPLRVSICSIDILQLFWLLINCSIAILLNCRYESIC